MKINGAFVDLSITEYRTFFLRLKGLMFTQTLKYNEGILLEPCNSIHTFFMNFPIDVVFLNKDNEIIHLAPQVKPWKFIFPIKHATKTLEFPDLTISKFQMKLGDKLEWK